MREKKREQFDVVIIGGGAAGLTAAIYCGRARLNTLLIEKSLIGGLATYTNEIANFPGFPDGITGLGLMELFHKQAKNFGVKVKLTDVKNVNFSNKKKEVETFRNIYETKAVIIASGGRPRTTGAENEEKFLFDKGISFCATCDAAANTGKTVMIIGSGDAAIEEGTFLSKFADKVIFSIIHDTGKMDCNEIAKQQVLANSKMDFKWNTFVHAFEGEDHLKTVVLKNLKTSELERIDVDTCFEFIGYLPNTKIFNDKIELTDQGYVVTDENMYTDVDGVFACGDVRDKILKQVATAVGDGAIAGVEAEKYISETEIFYKQLMQKEKIGFIYIYSAIDSISRELLPMMKEIENELKSIVKLNVVDLYKEKRLCEKLDCKADPMKIIFTKNGEIVGNTKDCSKNYILKKLKELAAE